MRISTKGRYALRLMLDLATNCCGDPIRLKDVAKRQEISEKYLEQIISVLNKAGFVRSIRGPRRLCPDTPPGRIHRRHDPAADRRQSGTGRVRGKYSGSM